MSSAGVIVVWTQVPAMARTSDYRLLVRSLSAVMCEEMSKERVLHVQSKR